MRSRRPACLLSFPIVSTELSLIFEQAYRDLRPRAPMPQIHVRFYRFVGLNTTIRLRAGRIYVHLSDLLEAAPVTVIEAIAHILLAKLYRKPIERSHEDRYRRFVSSAPISQQAERMRHIGVLMNTASDDPLGQARVAAFQQALQQLGWSDGRNVRIDIRWGRNDVEQDRKYAAELVALTPDVILAVGTLSVAALQRESRTIPIVFDSVSDPVGAGFVDNLAHPGGNTTGFMIYEYGLSGKWLEFLKQMAPWIKRAGVLRNSANPAGIAQFGAIRAMASSLGVDVSPINVREASEIEGAIATYLVSNDTPFMRRSSAPAEARAEFFTGVAPLTMKLAPGSASNAGIKFGSLIQSCAHASLARQTSTTLSRRSAVNFAVMHNAAFPTTMW